MSLALTAGNFSFKGECNTIQFIDMFAGIGGFGEGLSRAGGFTCVGHCEYDKYAERSYRALFDTEGEWYTEDARNADPDTMPDFDLLCGGFPCQAFSLWLAAAEGLETPAAPSFLSLPAWLKRGSLAICCLRTYPACLTMTKAGRLRRSSMRWADWGTMSNGRCLTAKILALRSQDAAYTLSDFLTSDVPERYYLSPQQQQRLLPDDWGKASR